LAASFLGVTGVPILSENIPLSKYPSGRRPDGTTPGA
jgi:hypothetical protein